MDLVRPTIRPARITDLSDVEMVARTTWRIAYAGIIPDDVQRRLLDTWYSPESLSRALVAKGSTFLVAEWDRRVVGFAQYMRRSAESVELTRIYVLPDSQRRGIGTLLIGAELAAFAAASLKRLTVSVERENIIGRRFYETMGFVEPRALTREIQGYSLELLEYRRAIP